MNNEKYKKLYLQENWADNRFNMVKYYVEFKKLKIRKNNKILTIDLQRNHPLVKNGNAFWITHNTLCIGYELSENPQIFRPIFSHKRQKIIDKLNPDIKNPSKFWNKIKSQYFLSLAKIRKLPVVCIDKIVMFVR